MMITVSSNSKINTHNINHANITISSLKISVKNSYFFDSNTFNSIFTLRLFEKACAGLEYSVAFPRIDVIDNGICCTFDYSDTSYMPSISELITRIKDASENLTSALGNILSENIKVTIQVENRNS